MYLFLLWKLPIKERDTTNLISACSVNAGAPLGFEEYK